MSKTYQPEQSVEPRQDGEGAGAQDAQSLLGNNFMQGALVGGFGGGLLGGMLGGVGGLAAGGVLGGLLGGLASSEIGGGTTPGQAPRTPTVFSDDMVGPLQEGDSRLGDLKIDKETKLNSALGEMNVYPDDYSGKLPDGAVKLSDFKKMHSLYEKIDRGDSQLKIDTSDITKGIDPKIDPEGYKTALEEASQFRGQMMGYLKDLVKTPEGLNFLTEMDASKHTTTIKKGAKNETTPDSDADAANGKGTNTTITLNPNLSTYKGPGEAEKPWMTDRPKFGLYHEMLHAYHHGRGDEDQGVGPSVHTSGAESNSIRNWEYQVMGFGKWSNEKYTDNKFRKALGKEERPHYSGWTPK